MRQVNHKGIEVNEMDDKKIVRRTVYILYLFHLFYCCETVSYHLIRYYIPETRASKKTIQRYIRFLEDAGLIRLRYSRKERSYVPVNRSFVPDDGQFYPAKLPDKKPQRLYMEKIIRLCTLITDVVVNEVDDPVAWYHENYPELSDRTRQRDFKQLKEVGYEIDYFPGDEWEPARYYYHYYLGV